ncbi:MAG TPA: hypothetical protein VNA89_05055 [Gemmatimonadaceae bacterium]|nr:hypothetical protein [Gemmatimonadaceae bacterium]
MNSFAHQLRRLTCTLASMSLVAAVACDGKGTGPQNNPPATVTKQTNTDNQTASAGTVVANAPAVVVRDAKGRPVANVSVAFAVASGGGGVTGPTAKTDAQGVARVGSWTLGPSAGANTLSATVETVLSVVFSATGSAGAPASVAKVSGADDQSATVGTSVATAPAVRVTDAYGNPVSGAAVTFAVAAGGGSVAGGSAVADANGVATVGSWTLGTTAGANALSASAGDVAPVTFLATGTVGAPARIVKTAGDGQKARAGTYVLESPVVTVTDAHGNPLADVVVHFTVLSGGGNVEGTPIASNESGEAMLWSWRVGPDLGLNELTASIGGGVPPATFTAMAVGPCDWAADLRWGFAILESLSADDCDLSSFYTDYYSTTVTAPGALFMSMSDPDYTGTINPMLELYDADGKLVAFNDDYAAPDAGFLVLLAPGTYITRATSSQPEQTGTYMVWAQPSSGSIDDCSTAWAVRGVTTTQTLATTDCFEPTGERFSDRVALALEAGEQVTVTMTGAAHLSALLNLYDSGGAVVAQDSAYGGPAEARIIFTATSDGVYVIEALSDRANDTGTYTLSIQ